MNVEDEEVWQRLRLIHNFDEKLLSRIVITSNGNVIAKTEDGDGLIAMGCRFCIMQDHGQDNMGYPTLGGVRLLYFGDVYRIEGIDEAVKANTWLCPVCRIPINSIYPKFGKRREKNVSIQNG